MKNKKSVKEEQREQGRHSWAKRGGQTKKHARTVVHVGGGRRGVDPFRELESKKGSSGVGKVQRGQPNKWKEGSGKTGYAKKNQKRMG